MLLDGLLLSNCGFYVLLSEARQDFSYDVKQFQHL